MADHQLLYLFGAHFADGTEYFQTEEDISSSDPTRSAFHDIAQRLNEVQLFQLTRQGHTCLVDLRDGHFEIDGVPFSAGDPSLNIPPGSPRRLNYFRRHSRVFQGRNQIGHAIEYHIGWQATVNGKNHQVTISVS